jgi:hypothetical protein
LYLGSGRSLTLETACCEGYEAGPIEIILL